MSSITDPIAGLIQNDPLLAPYEAVLRRRSRQIDAMQHRLTQGVQSLADFASGHEYYGLHRDDDGWVFREWAPNASAIYLIGTFSRWCEHPAQALTRISPEGSWELRLAPETLGHGDLFRLRVHWPGGSGDRLPAYARRVVQDPETLIFNAQVWRPAHSYPWRLGAFHRPPTPPLIYEVHVGMAQESGGVGSWRQFTEHVLPRIVVSGYNTLQLMAVQEHPYYGSFGYHVANFFAASSRFGPPEDLKDLIDTAHEAGLAVIMDLVHSHSVSNEVEGLSRFDGTTYQYFHEGPRGRHEAWDSRCFDYAKPQVLHFLLSNCRYWLDEYKVDGFRFDGITSMLYLHHGLGSAFTSYDDYFNAAVDEEALVYLALANRLIHHLRPDALTIAEDVSGMPGLALTAERGGIGFDYRFAMGVPDYWIKLTKDTPDEHWPMSHLWFELTNRRREEQIISYAESHDQALVGDQTLAFRLMGAAMYDHMTVDDPDLSVARGMALHKMIRLITLATAGNGYLNFMGNEFGHPEWIDFPRAGNNWSYHYARRQWHLMDAEHLKYRFLALFDRAMITLAKTYDLLGHSHMDCLWTHDGDKVLAFQRAGLYFFFNFHPQNSYEGYGIPAPPGTYTMCLDSDASAFGGHGRLVSDQQQICRVWPDDPSQATRLKLYLPNRTAVVLVRRVDDGGKTI
jgi:1,4-alpha-glucan branching enzyme